MTQEQQGNLKILIVEDDFMVRQILRDILEPYGVVDIAVNGEEAVQAFRVAWRQNHPYDLICMDIMMPVMDGIALALSVARDHPGLAILLMTGFADQRERAFGLDSLVSDVVSKPFTLAEIRAAVGRALDGRSPSSRIA